MTLRISFGASLILGEENMQLLSLLKITFGASLILGVVGVSHKWVEIFLLN
jgi:hypothetical protein